MNSRSISTGLLSRTEMLALFGRNLRRARNLAGLSRKAVARRVGVDVSTISRMEAGRCCPHYEQLPGLLAALSVRLADLLRE